MTEIAKIVRKETIRQGVIPFAEFMRLALYCPNYGYYEQVEGRIGRRGDFYTNVSVGGLFGALLGFSFAEWLEQLSIKPSHLVEVGADGGQLAADILGWFSLNRPTLLDSVEYWIIEPSPRQKARQRAKLERFADRVRWFDSLASIAETGVTGIIFSNELLDAMPVHRLAWDASAGCWVEWGVALADEAEFIWKKMPREPGYLANELNRAGLEIPPQLLAALPDGFIIEICPEARAWWRQAAVALKAGRLLTIDYGLSAEQFLAPERPGGTLRAYYKHRMSADLLARVGEQDLTAQVNFTQLQRAGEEAGLRTEGLFSQERFLTNLAAKTWQKDSGFGDWTPAGLRQFQTLTHPGHLGRPFSVLVQVRD